MRRRQVDAMVDLAELKSAENGKEPEKRVISSLPESLYDRLKFYVENHGGRNNSMNRFINAAIEERLDRLEARGN